MLLASTESIIYSQTYSVRCLTPETEYYLIRSFEKLEIFWKKLKSEKCKLKNLSLTKQTKNGLVEPYNVQKSDLVGIIYDFWI